MFHNIKNQWELDRRHEASKRTCEACTRSKVKCGGPPTCLRCLRTDQRCIFRPMFKRGRKRKHSVNSSSPSRNSSKYDSIGEINHTRMLKLQDSDLNGIVSSMLEKRMPENVEKYDSMVDVSELLDRNGRQSSTYYVYESLVQVSFERCPLCKLPVLIGLGKSNRLCSACMTGHLSSCLSTFK